MRHYYTSCGPMSCVPTRKDGIPELFIKHPYVVQWCSDTISEMTTLVISLMVLLYHCKTYRALIANSGTSSFLVVTQLQHIGLHEVL